MNSDQKVFQSLIALGLSEPEATVYLALLSKGTTAINDLSSVTNLPRSTVVVALDRLVKRFVVKTLVKGKRSFYFVEDPRNLERISIYEEESLKLKQSLAKSLVPQLELLHHLKPQGGINTQVFRGESGFQEVYKMSLNQPRGSEILRFGVATEKFTVQADFLRAFVREKKNKGIKTRLLIPDGPLAKVVKKDSKLDLRQTKTLPKNIYNPPGQIVIWGNNVAFTTWDKELTTLVITSKSLVETLKMIFEMCWNFAK